MKKILIPTDFSDNAWDALTYAIRLYDDIPCKFYILNTYEITSIGTNAAIHGSVNSKMYKILKEESEKELEKIENYLNEYLLNDKHEYKVISQFGSMIGVVKEIVNLENIDLIVMGTTGASGLKEAFLGSNTVNIIKHISECPLIAVPKDFEYKEPELVSFATDLKKTLNDHELNTLKELLLIHNLNLEVLHVRKERSLNTVQKQNIETIKNVLGSENVSYKEIPLDKSIANSINKYLETYNIDIVCLANYEHTFLEKITREPILKKLGFHTKIPLLVICI